MTIQIYSSHYKTETYKNLFKNTRDKSYEIIERDNLYIIILHYYGHYYL